MPAPSPSFPVRARRSRPPSSNMVLPTVLALVFLVSGVSPAQGQSMRDLLDDLFVFGPGDSQLFLVGSGGVEATAVHGNHFIPSASESNGAVLEFFTQTIALNVSSFPLPSTVSSETFEIVEGVPVATSSSFGPISTERAQTIGRGRVNVGVEHTRLGFQEMRGIPLRDIRMTFLHENSDFPGCDEFAGGDCSLHGVPQFENDLIDLVVDLDLRAAVTTFYGTFGVADRLDVSIAVPVVDLHLSGVSRATVTPSTGDQALHFFGGTPEDPVLEATGRSFGGTTGIGDVAVRVKGRLTRSGPWDAAILAGLRVPTGREEDFLGSGAVNARGLLILSGRFEGFSPHLNAGYEHRARELDPDRLDLAVGFDHRLSEWATLAADLLGSFVVTERELEFPDPAVIEAPFRREIPLTNIPDRRDDTVDGSFGLKLRTGDGIVVLANVLIPLNDGGLRAGVIPTFGVEYPF